MLVFENSMGMTNGRRTDPRQRISFNVKVGLGGGQGRANGGIFANHFEIHLDQFLAWEKSRPEESTVVSHGNRG